MAEGLRLVQRLGFIREIRRADKKRREIQRKEDREILNPTLIARGMGFLDQFAQTFPDINRIYLRDFGAEGLQPTDVNALETAALVQKVNDITYTTEDLHHLRLWLDRKARNIEPDSSNGPVLISTERKLFDTNKVLQLVEFLREVENGGITGNAQLELPNQSFKPAPEYLSQTLIGPLRGYEGSKYENWRRLLAIDEVDVLITTDNYHRPYPKTEFAFGKRRIEGQDYLVRDIEAADIIAQQFVRLFMEGGLHGAESWSTGSSYNVQALAQTQFLGEEVLTDLRNRLDLDTGRFVFRVPKEILERNLQAIATERGIAINSHVTDDTLIVFPGAYQIFAGDPEFSEDRAMVREVFLGSTRDGRRNPFGINKLYRMLDAVREMTPKYPSSSPDATNRTPIPDISMISTPFLSWQIKDGKQVIFSRDIIKVVSNYPRGENQGFAESLFNMLTADFARLVNFHRRS